MDPRDLLRADPLDILFENRNKSYGAYPLRKYYAQRLGISFGITLSLVTVTSFLYLHMKSAPMGAPALYIPDPVLVNVDLGIRTKAAPVSVKVAAHRAVAKIDHPALLIVPDRADIKPLATTQELEKDMAGVKTTEGPSDGGDLPGPAQGSGTATVKRQDAAEAKQTVFAAAEVMPEFPGGIEALKRYLLKNLRMPDNGLEPGTRVQVIARFVVGSDGRVKDIEILQPAAEDFNREVKRVIAHMPNWKPGLQNHLAVPVYFNLPVNFENEE
jgi:periplasmic protein TonB